MARPRDQDEVADVADTPTVTFGFLGAPPGFSYDPKCLAVEAGADQGADVAGTFRASQAIRRSAPQALATRSRSSPARSAFRVA